MRAPKSLFSAALASAAVAAVGLSACTCGDSSLTKAYESYDASVAPLLDRDKPLWNKTVEMFNEQLSGDTADHERFAAFLHDEAAPFYAELTSKVAQVSPADPALAPAHEALTKYAASRAAFVKFVGDNLEVLNPEASADALSRKQNAAQSAVEDYQAATRGSDIVDPRFGQISLAEQAYAERCMKPFTEGRMSVDDVREFIRNSLLPPLRSLMQHEKFGDDEKSQLLRKAILAAEDFYTAVADNLPLVDRNVRFGAEVSRRTAEGDELLKKFLEEMAAVRKRM